MARIWKGGCIIRATLLDPVRHAFDGAAGAASTCWLDPAIADDRAARGRRDGAARSHAAVEAGIPMLAHSSRASATSISYRTARLPQNLTQAQRDAFGAHTYERIDRPGRP